MWESKLHRFSNDHPLLKLPEVSNLVYLSDFNRQGYFQKILIEVCLLDAQCTTYKKAHKFLRFCEKMTYSHTSKYVSLNPSGFDSKTGLSYKNFQMLKVEIQEFFNHAH